MNGPMVPFGERAAQPADIDVALGQLLDGTRKETPSRAKNLKKFVVAAATQIADLDHAGVTAVPHRGVIRSCAATDGQVLVIDNIHSGLCRDHASNYRATAESAG